MEVRHGVPGLTGHRKNLRQIDLGGRFAEICEHRRADLVGARQHRALQSPDLAPAFIRRRCRDAMTILPLRFEQSMDEVRSLNAGHDGILS